MDVGAHDAPLGRDAYQVQKFLRPGLGLAFGQAQMQAHGADHLFADAHGGVQGTHWFLKDESEFWSAEFAPLSWRDLQQVVAFVEDFAVSHSDIWKDAHDC